MVAHVPQFLICDHMTKYLLPNLLYKAIYFHLKGGNIVLVLFCVLILNRLSTQRHGGFCLEEKDPGPRCLEFTASPRERGRFSHQPEKKQLW